MSEAFGKTLARKVEALKDHLGNGGALQIERVRLMVVSMRRMGKSEDEVASATRS